MTRRHCDVAVIGAGTAGLAAERAARSNGASTLLIDPEFAGTVCATVGCMPSKLLIAAAHAAHRVRGAGEFGIRAGAMEIDGPAVMERVRRLRDDFAEITRASIAELPDGICVRAKAAFSGPNRLSLDDGSSVSAKAIVIATGSSPAVPEPFAKLGEHVVTNRSIFEIADLPRRLAVIGAGPIGLELAQAMARLGVEVTVFDRAKRLLGLACDDVHDALVRSLKRDVTLVLGVEVEAEADGDGVRIRWSGDDDGACDVDRILLAIGRPPQLDGLDLEASGLELDEHGVPLFDRETMQCGDAPIFIAGDADADVPVLHEASQEGAIAGRNAVAYPAVTRAGRSTRFSMVFTDPVCATIGRPAEKGGISGGADYGNQGRARVEGREDGALRLYGAAPDGRLTGAELCAPGGEHLAHLICWAVEQGMTAGDVLEMPFYHPTLEEGLKGALRDICKATPIPFPDDQDSGNAPGT